MKWKNLLITIVASIILFAGCDQARQQQPGQYEKLAAVINELVDGQQKSNADILVALKESDLIADAKMEKLETKVASTDEIVDVAQIAAAEAARVYDEKASEGKIIAAIEAARAANTASAAVNPYAPLIDAGLGIAAIIAGAYGYKEHKEKVKTGKKYTAHKRAAEKLMRETSIADATKIYDAIGAERKKIGI